MCGCGSAVSYGTYQPVTTNRELPRSTEYCPYTKSVLIQWLKILNCIKAQNKKSLIQASDFNINSLLGIIQSALNYPDDYCFYKPQLEEFQNTFLPRIIEYVPECAN